VTFKDLKKRVSLETTTKQQQLRGQQKQNILFERIRDKPFWIWNIEEHKLEDIKKNGNCCFNHIIGLPTKEGVEKAMFDYEKILYDSLLINDVFSNRNDNFKHKHLWVKKATGLGVTEFFLRLMAWLSLRNNDYQNSQMCVVTGPNIDIAIKLIKRMKGLFEPKLGITFDSKETVLELNGCSIEAYPSNHIDAYRALYNPKFILLDESDFFRKGEQEDVRSVSERYIAKSDPYIVMVSTPNAPDGLFERIEKEPEDTCLYKRMFLDYTYGIGKIYTAEEIEKAKQSPSFEREYNLKYLGKVGNVFSRQDIDIAVSLGNSYNPTDQFATTDPSLGRSLGVDPGFGSSATGLVLQQWKDGHAEIIIAEQYERASISDMVNLVYHLVNKHYVTKIFVDASQPGFIKDLKRALRENEHYEKYSREELHCMIYRGNMRVCPISFGAGNGEQMLHHAKILMEKHFINIHLSFDKLITSLKTAWEEDGVLDKEITAYNIYI
jgi:hypothetical protein